MTVFVFTDIEGSTRLWQRDASAMALAVKEHDALLHQVITDHGGHIVKSTGDGAMAVFDHVLDAVAAALFAQRAIPRLSIAVDLKIRIGVHCGEAEERDGDWFGPAVNEAARIADCGHGGQILVSAAAAAADLADGAFSLRDLGRHPLRDLDGDHQLFQVEAAGLAGAFPALRTPRMAPNNLPTPPTRLVGRLPELRAAHDALHDGARTVTLTGPGGMGKTRLALQVATDALGRYADGVWLVELAPRSGPSAVLTGIRAALGLSDRGNEDPAGALSAHLRDRHVLLILDNFEHVVAEASLVAELLNGCPSLNVVATSRVPLRIRGERVVNVPPLSVPDVDASAAHVLDSGAGRLFTERARDVLPSFALDQTTAHDVAAVARSVEGIPLALEIAAGRLLDMDLAQLRDRLVHRLDTLGEGPRDLPERHQTLRATIAWGWDLLREDERVALRRIAVLPGGVTAASAAATSRFPIAAAESILGRLASASFLTQTAAEAGTRWTALEAVREFALERLEADDDPARARDDASQWVTEMAVEVQQLLHGSQQGDGVAQLATEIENVREALRELLGSDPVKAIRLAEAISRWWVLRGQLREGTDWLEQAVDRAPETAPYYRPALTALAALAGTSGDHAKAAVVADRALALSRAAEDETSEVIALNILGSLAIARHDYERAEEIYRRSRELMLAKGRSFTLGTSTNNLGLILSRTRRWDQAIPLHEEALALFEELGDPASQSTSLKYLGTAFSKLDRWEEAEDAYVRAIKLSEVAGHRVGLAEVMANLALVRAARGEPDDARALLEEAWARAVEAGSLRGQALVSERRASIELDLGNRADAARYWHQSADLLEEAGSADAESARARAREIESGAG